MKQQQAFAEKRTMLKGALHCHTTRSDGKGTPEEVIRYHYEHGYDFLAITDHRIYNYRNFAPEVPITIVPGMEFDNTIARGNGMRCFHTVCIGPAKEDGNGFEQDVRLESGKAKDQYEYQTYLDDIHAKGNLTIYCHPEWSSTPARYFENQQGNFAMEIRNSGCVMECDMDADAAYWDELLGQGKRIYGVATDDGHSMEHHCNGWVMVNAENDLNAILAALKEGKFYSSCGPEIYNFYIEDNVAVVECSAACKVRFHSDRHPTRIVRDEEGGLTRAEFKMDKWPGPYNYIRAVVIDKDGKYAWTNPIFLDQAAFADTISARPFFEQYQLEIGEATDSPFMNKNGVYQDGTTPMYRDTDGRLWAMSGHSHKGEIAMFCGTSLDDMKKAWPIETNFSIGHAEYAFAGVRYPEGILPRGSIWPFGLYICPNTHRFFCWFHNETGWNGRGTAYDAFGLCQKPQYDSDFRHIGLMHSDDEGKTWTFDRWVLTGEEVAFTSRYNPGAGNVLGQAGDIIRFGSGDFSLFVEPEGEYIYLFYNIITMDLADETGRIWTGCDAYVARCRKRADGTMGDFVKYYNGSFSEAGNLGKETKIVEDMWHPRVVYSIPEQVYIMTGKPILRSKDMMEEPGMDAKRKVMQIAVSKDLIHWSAPEVVYRNGAVWGNHYNAIVSEDPETQPHILASDTFSVLNNHNGTDVLRHKVRLVRKPL